MQIIKSGNIINFSILIHNNNNNYQRLLRATSWYELFAPLSNLQSGVFCIVIPLFVGYTRQKNCYVCKKGLPRLSSKRELLLRKKIVIITQKGN